MMASSQSDMNLQVSEEQQPEFIRFQTIRDGKDFVMGLDRLYRDLLQEGTDYGKLPGTTKPCMFKSGGEILAKYFGLTTSSRLVQRIVERDPAYIEYSFATDVYYTGTKVADGSGSCNSMEPKYAFRYDHGVQREATDNEIFGLQNTIMKMAIKRSYIDAILRATGASRIFTQDLDDMDLPSGERSGIEVKNHNVRESGKAAVPDTQINGANRIDNKGNAKKTDEKAAGIISGSQKGWIQNFLNENGVHHEIATLMIGMKGRQLDDLTGREASEILNMLFNFKCADLPTEKFVMENEGFRLENGILRPPMNTLESVSMEKRLELAKACWIWDADKKGFMRKEAAR